MNKIQSDGDRIFVIEDFFSLSKCSEWIQRSEELGFDEAPINSSMGAWETIFYHRDQTILIVPQTGKALIFEQEQLHEGAPVRKRRKYVLRTDVMYRGRRD